ncbi:MAG: EscU/YscU/HrcU family type III secretion system export apparatus switch protein [Armatimonadetes bacterium]|nr:EscU/YscU/HrcU family type III secretion system export apparatus switch protein [Armatimonadota bacterium]
MKDSKEPKSAIALRYDAEKDQAPRVVAAGKGWIADKIVEIAEHHKVPLHKEAVVAEALQKVELGTEIPQALYQVIAEILFFVNRLNEKWLKKAKERKHS